MSHALLAKGGGPLVSVIITAYNYGHTLASAIDSVLRQDYEHLEVLVLDNASTDTTAPVAASYAHDPRVRYMRHEHNIGMIPNHNVGLRAARGEYIIFLSADDRLMPHFLRRALAYYVAHPEIDIVYSALYLMDAQGRLKGTRAHELPASYEYSRDELPWLLACNGFICLPTLLVRRDIYERFGCLDETVFGADYDLTLRWAQAGIRFGYLAEGFAAFRIHATQQTGVANFSKTGKQIIDHLQIVTAYLRPENEERLRGFENRITQQIHHQYHLVESEGYADDGAVASKVQIVASELAAMRERNKARPFRPRITVFVVPGSLPVLLEQSLASLVGQTETDWEAIVIEQPGISLIPWCEQLDPASRIRGLHFATPTSPAHALNIAMSISRGNTYAFLKAGTRFAPDYLAALARSAAVGNALYVTPLALRVYDEQRKIEYFRQTLTDDELAEKVAVAPTVGVDAIAFRRELLDDCYGFAENLQASTFWDFCVRACRVVSIVSLSSQVEQDCYVGYPHEFFAPTGMTLAISEIYERHPVADVTHDKREAYVHRMRALLTDPAAAMVSANAVLRTYATVYDSAFTVIEGAASECPQREVIRATG